MTPAIAFRKVATNTWGDARFSGLSEPAKLLWFYLLTGPEVSNLPGLMLAGRAHLAEAMGWSVERFDDVFAELAERDEDGTPMASADWRARVVWIPKAHLYNKPANPNVVTGWARAWLTIPESTLKLRHGQALRAMCSELGTAFLDRFDSIVGNLERVCQTVTQTKSKPPSKEHSPAPAPAPAIAPVFEGVQGGTETEDESGDQEPEDAPELTSDQKYAAAFVAGVTRGKGAPHVWLDDRYEQGALNRCLPAYAVAGGKPLRGPALLDWIERAACAFARHKRAGDPQYTGGYAAKLFAKWLNDGAPGFEAAPAVSQTRLAIVPEEPMVECPEHLREEFREFLKPEIDPLLQAVSDADVLLGAVR